MGSDNGYLWLLVVGAFAAFFFGWGTGSNDVANAFGTSVGSGALTVKQAILIAAIFEFGGALALGRVSTSTISGGIADIKVFQDEPNGALIYSYGMMWTLILGGIWQGYASSVGLNVSATHSIIAGIIGFSLVFKKNSVLWITDSAEQWPPYQGIVPIVVAWVFSPVSCGFCSCYLFKFFRWSILRSPHGYTRVFYVFPLLVLCTTWINIYFVFTKGAKKSFDESGTQWSDNEAAWIAACISIGAAIFAYLSIPYVRDWSEKWTQLDEEKFEKRRKHMQEILEGEKFNVSSEFDRVKLRGLEIPPDFLKHPIQNIKLHFKNLWNIDYGMDFFDNLDDFVESIHDHAETFNPKVEKAFGFLQIFSATCVMFAHGAGDVGYMAGPLTTIWVAYNTNTISKNTNAPIWIIVLCALGLVTGLATYGRNVIKTVGKDFAFITPSRGFAAEISTAIILTVAAQYGLPTSSSQTITGGIIGIGIVEGLDGVNWKLFAETFLAWIATMCVMGLGTSLMFAQGHFAP